MFIGRDHELALIRDRLEDHSRAQLILIYGRRRIGKSTLIRRTVDGQQNVLFFEGIEGQRKPVQIAQFLDDLARQTGRVRLGARTWREVFQGIGELVHTGRWVLVFDEFPWMGSGRTQIVSELKLHWDRWIKNPNICLFLCGSVASFMIRHVVHSRALHNRKTPELCLGPLQPCEAGRFIPRRGIREKAQLYMCLGGVPKYLEQIDPRRSLEQNLNQQCFTAGGFFVEEFETLFKEQFRSLKVYKSIVESLARAPASLAELARRLGKPRGGGFQEQLNNLIRAQFVREYAPVKIGPDRRSRTRRFKLVDPFLIFYFRYIHPHRDLIARNRKENLFRAIAGPSMAQYYGYAFERLGEDAMNSVLARIGITLSDVEAMGPYFQQQGPLGTGLQIDWLIRRRDLTWTLMEFKYASSPVGKEVVHQVSRKVERLAAPKEVIVEPVLLTASGASSAVKRHGLFNHILTLKDLVLA